MKIYPVILFLLCFFQPSFSQDTAKLNNGLLLEYYQNQRFDEAAAYLKKTNPEPITDIKILKALAYCTQMDSKLPEAESYYERIYAIDSTSTAVLFSLGSINLRRGNSQKAEVWYKKIILKDSSNFIVYKQLAKISADKKDIAFEIFYLQKANQLNPEDADVASDLADFYTALKNYGGAEKVLTQAINADPDNMLLLQSLVKLEYHQENWPATANNCEKLVALGDMSGAVLTEMGIAYYNINDFECGIESFGQIDDNEQNETTCYYTGACYKQLKNYTKALEYFQKTIDKGISPNINSYFTEMADTYESIKNYKKAELAYQKALQFSVTPLTYYQLGNLYDTELKNRKKAVLYYKKYLASKPPLKQSKYVVYAKSRMNLD